MKQILLKLFFIFFCFSSLGFSKENPGPQKFTFFEIKAIQKDQIDKAKIIEAFDINTSEDFIIANSIFNYIKNK